ncbi:MULTISPECIES: cytochrome c-type biogenesis protein [Thalassotalea]|uniref:cytochrome c-type biogenesis protein n=1 Tax=Thalassotalea TaxID=1518149 RepID=UPI000942D55F|nr:MULTISPECIES: cytochrome c-type biogenesis protein [Thalassotalea]OKY26065.1 cytochrome c-type biogenesis protein CcmH [Thalassotalea sp. PP2-459]
MKMFTIIVILLLGMILSAFPDKALATDTYVFDNPVTEIRYKALIKELRCPKCQNQNLADSNAPIAKDLRREVFQLLQEGKADKEIVDFMVARYGEFVLYRPKVSPLTYVLWFGPLVLLLIGIVVLVLIVRKKPTIDRSAKLSSQQKSQLDQILKDK